MESYMITYDLRKPDRDYTSLHKEIKALSGVWAHIVESSWLIASSKLTAKMVRDRLAKTLDRDDELFVGKMSGEGAWKGLNKDQTAWLKDNL